MVTSPRRLPNAFWLVGVMVTLLMLACAEAVPTPTSPPRSPTSSPTSVPPTPTATLAPPTETPQPTPNAFAGVPGIVDASNMGWPRDVEGLNGRVTIPTKPERIIAPSLGHSEITYALVPAGRVVAVGSAAQDPTYSNVAELAAGALVIRREPEQVLARQPDVIVESAFAPPEFIEALTNVGVPVVQTGLRNDPEGRIQDILLMGYIYGEEERALELAAEVRQRYGDLVAVTRAEPEASRPRVLALTSYSEQLWVAGAGSTEGGIVEAAGGINVAAEAGIQGNQTSSLEGVIAMAPEVIIIPQPEAYGAGEFKDKLLSDPVLAEVPAIREGQVYVVSSNLYTTLSFWNVRGAEDLAAILWPEDFGGLEFPAFSLPE